MTYRTEFPGFDYPLPSLEGFADQSWHNDVCPKLVREDGDTVITVWCDYADPDRRELMGLRYTVTVADGDHNEDLTISETDEWESVLIALRAGCWLD
jgi:hypothetical protein